MIDFKIKDAMKEFNTPEKEKKFLENQMNIYEKIDGVKVTLVRNDQPNEEDYKKNWIVSYKGSIQYPEEFNYVNLDTVEAESIGISQFAFVHEMLDQFHHQTFRTIPCNTELFIEFVMNKPTLTRDYTHKHKMVLLAAAPCNYTEKLGQLTTETTGDLYESDILWQFSDVLNIDMPSLLYYGAPVEFSLAHIQRRCLTHHSKYGGKIEGVVIKLNNGEMYKIVQDDQYDKETRLKKKNQYRMNEFDEWSYWLWVNYQAETVLMEKYSTLGSIYLAPAAMVYNESGYIGEYQHDKKTRLQILDDVWLTTKIKITKRMAGNNGALFVGRFQPITKAHVQIVRDALDKYDTVTVNVVRTLNRDSQESIDNSFSYELIKKMWEDISPDVKVQTTRTGNIITMLNKAENNINVVLAGSDRVESYNKQLERDSNTQVVQIMRSAYGVSATKLREALRAKDRAEVFKLLDQKHYKYITTLEGELK